MSATELGRERARWERAAQGDVGELLAPGMGAVLEQAEERADLGLELGTLRVALTRVLMEEDAGRMALRATQLAQARVKLLERQEKLAKGEERWGKEAGSRRQDSS